MTRQRPDAATARPTGSPALRPGAAAQSTYTTTTRRWGHFKRPRWGHCKRPLRSDSPLIPFEEELPDEAFEERELDLFISHATEDKAALVRPLAHALQHRGVEVWYDEFDLPIWHDTSKDELIRRSPSLLDRVALSTSALTVEEMADQIAEVVHSGGSKSRAA